MSSKVVTSFAVAIVGLVAAPAAPASAAGSVALHGTITGHWRFDTSGGFDAGARYLLTRGYGQTSLGVTGARGETGGLGLIREANCLLELRVTTASPLGQLSMRVTSLDPFPGGSSCKAYNFRWHVTKGTGAYAGMSGSGTGSFGMRNPVVSGGDGTFKIYFH